jgi:hypothetical protein
MLALSAFLVYSAVTSHSWLGWLLVLAAGVLLAFALHIGWLLLFGEPVARFTYHCETCGSTWEEREDQVFGMRVA